MSWQRVGVAAWRSRFKRREVPTFFDESKNIVTKRIYKKYKQVTSLSWKLTGFFFDFLYPWFTPFYHIWHLKVKGWLHYEFPLFSLCSDTGVVTLEADGPFELWMKKLFDNACIMWQPSSLSEETYQELVKRLDEGDSQSLFF